MPASPLVMSSCGPAPTIIDAPTSDLTGIADSTAGLAWRVDPGTPGAIEPCKPGASEPGDGPYVLGVPRLDHCRIQTERWSRRGGAEIAAWLVVSTPVEFKGSS
jgi:hypothetical protein